ncbi:helix-turn-helix transcriptional regulator [Citreimonas salinaria]|uniref:DNA-binding transcriptional regulator, CsgD family n=1 Tax=Citreimonas salinaria TaxID=321339 RepID=A0A1H3N694_9RHOB|nr:helix-turn-helix transcriptional regulator [Citreimonas salinaria]SDY83995.1 DNA-binding transcriptional regulator, CsgD family [Citreimonas salinaria]
MRHSSHCDEVSNLDFGLLYEAAVMGDCHEAILDMAEALFPNVTIFLYGQDADRINGNFLLYRGLKEEASRTYGTGVSAANGWFKKHWQQEIGRVWHGDELLKAEDLKKTRFYRDWLTQFGDLQCSTGVVIRRQGNRQVVLEVRYPKFLENSHSPMVKMNLTRLAPHLLRAERISAHYAQAREVEAERDNMLELISFPVMIIDDDCRVYNMNGHAQALCGEMKSIFTSADGFLHAVELQSEENLRGVLRDLSRDRARRSSSVVLPASERQERLFLTIVKVSSEHRFCKILPEHAVAGQCKFAIIAQSGTEKFRLGRFLLWEAYGLTASEAEVALCLLEGRSLGELAARKKLSKQTVRNQMGSVLRKTGTRRQPQLVSLLTRLAITASS